MFMKRSESKYPGFLSRLAAHIIEIWKQTSTDTKHNPLPPSDDSKVVSIGLLGSKWEFGCSDAATEIAILDDRQMFLGNNQVSDGEGIFSAGNLPEDVEDESSGVYRKHYESNDPDPYR